MATTYPILLFDLDGTLTDPKEGITRCIAHALERLGRDVPPPDQLLFAIGPPLRASFATLLDTDEASTIERAMTHYRERFATVGLFENLVYPGIPEMLVQLEARGYRLLLATAKPHVYARRILQHFNLLAPFDGIYGSELDGTRQDKSDLLGYLLECEAIDPANQRTVMVGDRRHDIDAAHTNACEALAVSWGYGDAAELAHADMHCAAPPEIICALAR